MPTKPLTDSQLQEALHAVEEGKSQYAGARLLGLSRPAVQRRLREAKRRGVTIHEPLSPDIPIEDLLAHRQLRWKHLSAALDDRKIIPITIDLDGPVGIAVFGDPHLDDEGCNWTLLLRHTEAVLATEGAYAACVGDITNNWIGRLAHLWGEQSTSARDAWRLAEWWIKELGDRLLWITEGNHDAWAKSVLGESPLDWIRSPQRFALQPHGLRAEIRLPSGYTATVNCRHDFRGRSQFNPAFGPAKAAWFGWRDDVLICGHLHTSGYSPLKDPKTGLTSHALRVASYKSHADGYAEGLGLPDQNLFEACLLIFDPAAADPRHRVRVYLDLEHGLQVLKWMRGKGAPNVTP